MVIKFIRDENEKSSQRTVKPLLNGFIQNINNHGSLKVTPTTKQNEVKTDNKRSAKADNMEGAKRRKTDDVIAKYDLKDLNSSHAWPTLSKYMLAEIYFKIDNSDYFASYDDIRVENSSVLDLIRPNKYISDTVVNAYMKLIGDRFSKKECIVDNFMLDCYEAHGIKMASSFVRNVDIFGQTHLLFPVFQQKIRHWTLVQVLLGANSYTFRCFDSLSPDSTQSIMRVQKLIADLWIFMKGEETKTPDMKIEKVHKKFDLDVQKESDCAVFVMMSAYFLISYQKPVVKNCDMLYFRNKIAYELLNAKILDPRTTC